MRILILTYHRAYNCGAVLQAWALAKALRKAGHEVCFPMFNRAGEPRHILSYENCRYTGLKRIAWFVKRFFVNLLGVDIAMKTYVHFSRFRRKNLKEIDGAPSDFGNVADVAIVGSDQVWRPDLAGEYFKLFSAESLPVGFPVIGYACSLGDKTPIPDVLGKIERACTLYHAVSVRETLAQECLRRRTSSIPELVVDPTLLLDAPDYEELLFTGRCPREEYLLMYVIEWSPKVCETARRLAKQLGVKCVIMPQCCFSHWYAPKDSVLGCSPDMFLAYTKNAKYILAQSFHGTVFAIQYKKPFLSLRPDEDAEESRPAALLRQLGMQERIVTPQTPIGAMETLIKLEPNWDAVCIKISRMRKESERFLSCALNTVMRGGDEI